MAYLTVDGGRQIYYERYRGSGRPVVLVHGWGMSVRVWDTVLPALLGAGHEVVSLDHRACGRSDKDFDVISIDAIGSDVACLVDELGLEGVVLNGWSLGGAVVVDAAAKLHATWRAWSSPAAPPRSTCRATAGPTAAHLTSSSRPSPCWPTPGPPSCGRSPRASAYARAGRGRVDVARSSCRRAPGPTTRCGTWGRSTSGRSWRDLPVPALVVHGVHDAIVPYDIGREAAQLLPHGRLVDFEQSGHAPFLEETAKYRSELLGFLSELG